MNPSHSFIAESIMVLALAAVFLFVAGRNRKTRKRTHLAALAFGFISAGILFGNDRLIGYPLLGIGAVLGIIDIVRNLRRNRDLRLISVSAE
jgi:hypothetical protein